VHDRPGAESAGDKEQQVPPAGHAPKSLQDMRKAHIEKVLRLAGGDIDKAAALLRISVTELRRWMTKLGIT